MLKSCSEIQGTSGCTGHCDKSRYRPVNDAGLAQNFGLLSSLESTHIKRSRSGPVCMSQTNRVRAGAGRDKFLDPGGHHNLPHIVGPVTGKVRESIMWTLMSLQPAGRESSVRSSGVFPVRCRL